MSKNEQHDGLNELDTEIPVTIEDKDTEEKVQDQMEEQEPESESSEKDDSNGCVEQIQRLQAEFQNYRKRIDRERIQLYDLAKGELTGLLLPVLDDFENMQTHHPQGQVDVEGVQLIHQKLRKILKDQGLEKIEALDQPFDPHYHEAIGVEETGNDRDGIVVEEWQKGYLFGERILRHSRVKVGKYTAKDGGSG